MKEPPSSPPRVLRPRPRCQLSCQSTKYRRLFGRATPPPEKMLIDGPLMNSCIKLMITDCIMISVIPAAESSKAAFGADPQGCLPSCRELHLLDRVEMQEAPALTGHKETSPPEDEILQCR